MVVDSPPPRRAATKLNGTATTAAMWLQQLQLHHREDADMVQLLFASSPRLGAAAQTALMGDLEAQAQRAFRPAAASRLASFFGGRSPTVTRGQEVAVLYTHCASRMLQYEAQVNGAEAVASLAERGTFRCALLACCIDMVACVYNQVRVEMCLSKNPFVIPAIHNCRINDDYVCPRLRPIHPCLTPTGRCAIPQHAARAACITA